MSGRSAHVRKKITQTKASDPRSEEITSATSSHSKGPYYARSIAPSFKSGYPPSLPVLRRPDGAGVDMADCQHGQYLYQPRYVDPGRHGLLSAAPSASSEYAYPPSLSPYGTTMEGNMGSVAPRLSTERDPHGCHPTGTIAEDNNSVAVKSDLKKDTPDNRGGKVRRGLAKTFAFGRREKGESDGDNPKGQLPSTSEVKPPWSSDIRSVSLQLERNLQLPLGNGYSIYHDSNISLCTSPPTSPAGTVPSAYSNSLTSSGHPAAPEYPLYPIQYRARQSVHRTQTPRPSFSPPPQIGPPLLAPPSTSPSIANDSYDSSSSAQNGGSVASRLNSAPQPAPSTPIKRWVGCGRLAQRWNKLRKDPELWDPSGDLLIFLAAKGQTPRPPPSFRLSSHILEATDLRVLVTMLRQGCTEDDTCSVVSAATPKSYHPLSSHPLRAIDGRLMSLSTPPPLSDDAVSDANGEISYEMYFPAPLKLSRVDQLRHQLTTRNVFALLCHVSLVGISLYQSLTDLHARLESYLDRDATISARDMIVNYLSSRGIDDPRNDAETAVSLMAWSEMAEVRWEDGWREGFMHCVGMHSQIESCTDWKYTAPICRALLERAVLEAEVRVQAAEERLMEFQLTDLWPTKSPGSVSPAHLCLARLQKWLVAYYSRLYGHWPPRITRESRRSSRPSTSYGNGSGSCNGIGSPELGPWQGMGPALIPGHGEDTWLTRTVAHVLQRDFGALYDYLVDRDVVWEKAVTLPGQPWMMVSESGGVAREQPVPEDTADLPLTNVLIEFDKKHRYPHIPHPCPLVPASIPSASSAARAGEDGGAGGVADSHKERRVHLAYAEATNMDVVGSQLVQSDLVEAFSRFEKMDHPTELDPALARQARWVLIYGILQTLATVSVDMPGLRYWDDVPYHLSLRLRGTRFPTWKAPVFDESSLAQAARDSAHELSHCWIVPKMWRGGMEEEVRKPDIGVVLDDESGGTTTTSQSLQLEDALRDLSVDECDPLAEDSETGSRSKPGLVAEETSEAEQDQDASLGPTTEERSEPAAVQLDPHGQMPQGRGQGQGLDGRGSAGAKRNSTVRITIGLTKSSAGPVPVASGGMRSPPFQFPPFQFPPPSAPSSSPPPVRHGSTSTLGGLSDVPSDDGTSTDEEGEEAGVQQKRRKRSQESVGMVSFGAGASVLSGNTFGYDWINEPDVATRRDFSAAGALRRTGSFANTMPPLAGSEGEGEPQYWRRLAQAQLQQAQSSQPQRHPVQERKPPLQQTHAQMLQPKQQQHLQVRKAVPAAIVREDLHQRPQQHISVEMDREKEGQRPIPMIRGF